MLTAIYVCVCVYILSYSLTGFPDEMAQMVKIPWFDLWVRKIP